MTMIYEKVTIDMLRQGVPFYRIDPQQHNHNVLPDYNINLQDDPNTEVWVVYPSWQKNPFIKPECFFKHSGLSSVVRDLIDSKNSDNF